MVRLSSIGTNNYDIRYSLDNGNSWVTYSQPIVVSEKRVHQILYSAATNNNNLEEPNIAEFTIKQDIYPPETSLQIVGTEGQNSYYNAPVLVSLTGIDEHAGVDYSEYSLDEGNTWKRYTEPFSIDSQTNTIVYYRSVDISGNVEKRKKARVNLDFTPPTAPDFQFDPAGWSNSSFLVTVLDGIDNESGTLKSQYRIGDSGDWLDYTNPVTVFGDTLKPFYARTIDYAGNISEISEYILQFDKIAPSEPVINLNTDWTNEPVYVRLDSGDDADSKVAGYEYKFGAAANWTEYVDPFFIEEEGIIPIYARTIDGAGNRSGTSEGTAKIDLTPPAAPANIFKINQIGNNVHIRWTPSVDPLSGVSKYRIYNGDEFIGESTNNYYTLTELKTGDKYTITVEAEDNAGNTSEASLPFIFFLNDYNVTAFRGHNFAWNLKGEVWGWGENNSGQLGDGTTQNKTSAIRIPDLDQFIMISAGAEQSLGLKADGTVWAWGIDSYTGQVRPLTQVQGLNNIVSISSGLRHYLALKADGTLWAWGNNSFGTLGDGTAIDRLTPVKVQGLAPVMSMAAGYYNSIALCEDGTVWVWGSSARGILGYHESDVTYNQLTPLKIAGLEGITQIDIQYHHAVALGMDGKVWTWGLNDSGQLGNGGVGLDRAMPQPVDNLSNIIKISTSWNHTLALSSEGEVWSWGSNDSGQVGDGTNDDKKLIPVRSAHLEGIRDVEAGIGYSLAVKRNGSLWSWGNNNHGQLGTGDTAPRITRTLINGIPYPVDTEVPSAPTNLESIGKTSATIMLLWNESKDNHSVKEYLVYRDNVLVDTLVVDGKTIDMSTSYTVTGLSPNKSYNLFIKARDYAGNLSESSNTINVTTDPSLPQIITSGGSYNLVLMSDSTVWGWGANTSGELGNGTRSGSNIAKKTGLSSVVKLSAGSSHSLAIKSDGTVWGWGYNSSGQLGRQSYDEITPVKINGIDSAVEVSAGSTHSLALKSDGTVWAWGSNFYGELGLGYTSYSYVYEPVRVPNLTGIKSISSSGYNSYALTNDGRVFAWGANFTGEAGNGTTTNVLSPELIMSLTNVVQISAGGQYVLALKQDGTVWAWGSNDQGKLGDGTSVPQRLYPVRVQNLSGIKEVAAGSNHSMARSDSNVYTWGANTYGQLGNNAYLGSVVPIMLTTVNNPLGIDAGGSHSVVLTASGAMAWGWNYWGQLGSGTSSDSRIPVAVKGLGSETLKSAAQYKQPSKTAIELLPEEIKADSLAPSIPRDVIANYNNGLISLGWTKSRDNIGVKEYWVYVNSRKVLETVNNEDVVIELPDSHGVNVVTVAAIDEAGNISTESLPYQIK